MTTAISSSINHLLYRDFLWNGLPCLGLVLVTLVGMTLAFSYMAARECRFTNWTAYFLPAILAAVGVLVFFHLRVEGEVRAAQVVLSHPFKCSPAVSSIGGLVDVDYDLSCTPPAQEIVVAGRTVTLSYPEYRAGFSRYQLLGLAQAFAVAGDASLSRGLEVAAR
jgi:hypothetical protein